MVLKEYIHSIILMISWCTWNVRGLNHQMKSKAVLDFLGSSSVGFCCLLETRVRKRNFDYVSKRFDNSWDYSCSYSNSGVGRIWVMWTFDFLDLCLKVSSLESDC